MFQNLKVDVIYYKTNSDFEMEFNLCGCCRMRLLSDKTPDKILPAIDNGPRHTMPDPS